MNLIKSGGRYESILTISDDGAIIANFILEYYTSELVALHFCVFRKNDIDWLEYYNSVFVPQLSKEIKHLIIVFASDNSRLRLLKSWGFEFTYSKEFDIHVFRDDFILPE